MPRHRSHRPSRLRSAVPPGLRWPHRPGTGMALVLVLALGVAVGGTAPDELLITLTGERSPAPTASEALAEDTQARALAPVRASRDHARVPRPVVAPTPAPTPSPRTPTRTPAPAPASPTPRPTHVSPEPVSPTPVLTRRERLERDVVRLTDEARRSHGCDAVRPDPALHRAARRHAAAMASEGHLDHLSLDGGSFVDRARAAGYADPASENIAAGQPGAAAVVKAWMASAGHRANILDCDVTDVGVGLARDGGTPYWAQVFGRG